MTADKFTLRELQPSDSPALVKLIADFDGDMVTQFHVDAYTALIFGLENRTLGVAVECSGVEGLVGLGTVRFSQVQFNGESLPLAFLDGLKVRKEFRGQGLGYRIADWRVQQARESFGERCVIVTGMLRSNAASRAVARKWCREYIDVAFQPFFVPVCSHPPEPLDGICVRQIEPGEYTEFARRQNTYYQDYNLFPPCDVQSITRAMDVTVAGIKPYRFFAATDERGCLLAGAQIWCRGMLKSDHFVNPPQPLRPADEVAQLLPPDLVIRDAAVVGLWHTPGQGKTAQFLCESLRWELRDQATTLTFALEPRDPLRQVMPANPLLMPRIEITIALHGPAPIAREKLLFGYGRI
jgi:GNAT superfamily N-acetyltransferase